MPYVLEDATPKGGFVLEDAQQPSSALDAPNAFGTGFNRGVARLVGALPDTAYNVRDLLKAAGGTVAGAVTGSVPDWLTVGDRSKDFASGENLISRMQQLAPGRMLMNPANPGYEGGYIQAAGGGLAGATPGNIGKNLAGTLLGKYIGEATGSPELAIAASLGIPGATQAVTQAGKATLRGGASVADVRQRIQDFRGAGVEAPTVGLVTGNPLIGGVENLLQSTPGAVGTMGRSRDAAIAGLQNTTRQAADLASTNRGPLAAGAGIQGGIQSFLGDMKARQGVLYDALGERMGNQYPTDIVQMRNTLGRLNTDIPGAPALSQFFKNGKIQALEGALAQDTAGTPPGVMNIMAGGNGLMNAPRLVEQVQLPGGSPANVLPFQAVKQSRTLVGNQIADNSLLDQVPQSKWKALYAGITDDLRNTAARNGPEASRAFNRANDFTRNSIDRLDTIAPFSQAASPEQAFAMAQRQASSNTSIFNALKKSLPEGARGQIAGTVIDELGTAKNGQQNASGTAWSPETFLTNWNKLTPKGQQALVSGFPNSAEVKASIDSVAKATSMMRDNSRMWANPSGTGANNAARAMLGVLGVGGAGVLTGLLNPLIPVGIATGMLGARGAAGLLTNQGVVTSLGQPTLLSRGAQQSQLGGLLGGGLLNGY